MVGAVHGYSHPFRDVKENIALRFAGKRAEGLNIAMLHCNAGGWKGHENFAPCSLDELRAARMDYWALGHVHTAEVLCRDPLVVYPGCTQGREEDFFQAVYMLKEKTRAMNDGLPVLLRLSLSGRGDMHSLLRRPGFLKGPGGLMETLNEGEEDRPDFVFIEEIVDETAPSLDLEALASGGHLVGDFLREAAAFREGGRLREGLENILRDREILDRISSSEALDMISSLTDEDVERLLDRGVFTALSGLLEGGGQ